ncbi:MAG: inositol monophosphatase [Alphaproteobacteria bacterium]|nr:inositol monophosphatase [Alphaproteobacteria bacterium]
MARQSALINVMTAAALKAARALARDFGEVENLQVTPKGPAEFVAIARAKAARTLQAELLKARPDFGLLLADGSAAAGGDRRWLVQPLDGAQNFLHGLPHFSLAIAVERAGELIAGIVYQPITQELFWAESGIGAFVNDRRLRVSGRGELGEALVAADVGPPPAAEQPRVLEQTRRFWSHVAGLCRLGAPALDLAYLAAGRLDGVWQEATAPAATAAGRVLVAEAGGFVSDLAGGAVALGSGGLLAANPRLHPRLLALLDRAAAAGQQAPLDVL